MANTTDNMNSYGVSWFKFDEASGNVTDSKGTSVGTVTGTTVVSGWDNTGKARSFNGTSDYITFNTKAIPLGKKSIRFKVKKTSIPTAVNMILEDCRGTATYGNAITIGTDGFLTWSSQRGVSGTPRFAIKSSISICDNLWHDILLTWDGTTSVNGVKMFVDNMITPNTTATAIDLETTATTYNLRIGAEQNNAPPVLYFFNGQLDEMEIYNDVISPFPDKKLIFHNGQYKYYTTSWQTIGASVIDTDYKTYGMDSVSVIPESAWSELNGTVELSLWSDYQLKTEASFEIETNSFTLANELGYSISVIEYTDNPTQTESATTIETDPFGFYKEMGDSLDVLYYTDGIAKTSADLEITANYSPLDELTSPIKIITRKENT